LLPNFIKIKIYRLLGYSIGKGTRLGFLSILIVSKSSSIGRKCRIAPFTFISSSNLQIGDYSEVLPFTYIRVPKLSIGCDSKISSFVIIRSGHPRLNSELIVGDIVHIFPFVIIDCSEKVTIGDETGIGPKCDIYTHSSYKSILDGYSVNYGDVVIGARVELTYRVFVSPNVTIGDDAICACGSYVNKDVPTGALVAGMPAIVKRTKEQITGKVSIEDIEQKLTMIIVIFLDNYSIYNNSTPPPVDLCISKNVSVAKHGAIYVLYNSQIIERLTDKFGLFEINSKQCTNNGLRKETFDGFRKFLSRYGIRFKTN